MIDREELLRRNSPHLTAWDPESPLTVGNGELAFTADITGLQTFYGEQKEAHVPLCTLSQWGWHSTPAGENRDTWYRPEDVKKTVYSNGERAVSYASEVQPGNETIYHWLRENPHRMNLIRAGFLWEDKELRPEQLKGADQRLSLQTGLLESCFAAEDKTVRTETLCAGKQDTLGVSIRSEALKEGKLSVLLAFPYGSCDITASDWEHDAWHETRLALLKEDATGIRARFLRKLDKDSYEVTLVTEGVSSLVRRGPHAWALRGGEETLSFTLTFSKTGDAAPLSFADAKKQSEACWKAFWADCGMIEACRSADKRGAELERRIVLSEYLLALQSLGSLPPQETGLTCNSWYGKFHLEMYPWHCAWAPLFNRPGKLKKSLAWYRAHLNKALANAACNGYAGARWPKQVDPDAVDSPSPIATLLIWQQPHILWMLYLTWTAEGDDALLIENREVITETARFMCDFARRNGEGLFDLPAPLIPAQENHDPRTTQNPTYELEYWSFALHIAADWAEKFGWDAENWREVAEHMAPPPEKDGLYLACETCPDTFTRFNKDHPSMVAALGLLPGRRIDPEKMRATLHKVLECWDYPTMWGWDFAMLAMTAVRLGDPETAIEILLKDTPKNAYVASGNNYQRMRTDLPLYLPGNGSLLLAAAMMTAGYAGCETDLPGFPKDGRWEITYENIAAFPY